MVVKQGKEEKVNEITCELKLSHSAVLTILKYSERIREAVKGLAPVQSTAIIKQRTEPIHEMEKLLNLD